MAFYQQDLGHGLIIHPAHNPHQGSFGMHDDPHHSNYPNNQALEHQYQANRQCETPNDTYPHHEAHATVQTTEQPAGLREEQTNAPQEVSTDFETELARHDELIEQEILAHQELVRLQLLEKCQYVHWCPEEQILSAEEWTSEAYISEEEASEMRSTLEAEWNSEESDRAYDLTPNMSAFLDAESWNERYDSQWVSGGRDGLITYLPEDLPISITIRAI